MFLPTQQSELQAQPDFVIISGDAYVDHPSFGHALIGRLIESQGFLVGIIAQPRTDSDYQRLGTPKHAFMVASGVVDSMVNNYTVAKNPRNQDDYSEGGVFGARPDRALSVYCKALKRLFPHTPIVAGGIEASLRRFAHYDYWADKVLPSVLMDAPCDLLVYGMGEKPLLDILSLIKQGVPMSKIKSIRGTAYLCEYSDAPTAVKNAIDGQADSGYILLSSYARVSTDKKIYAKAFNLQSQHTDPFTALPLIQKQSNTQYVVQNAPAYYLDEKQMDFVYSLPYTRKAHPSYKAKIPALEEVEFSITAHRGCFGGCSFCALTYHQGKHVHARSQQSIVQEATALTQSPDFKGYIHDIGGASANFHLPSCDKQAAKGSCDNKNCIGYDTCKNLNVSHQKYMDILRSVRKIKGIKKVFIRSGIRYDYLMQDRPEILDEIIKYHISGQLKVAPEHCSNNVLRAMNKPPFEVYERFYSAFYKRNQALGQKQFLVPYLISSHPACTLQDAVRLLEYLLKINYCPKQVQDFYPTPSTKSTTMYYTGLDPDTMQPIYTAKTPHEKAMQRALMQYRYKQNRELITEALTKCNRKDLLQKVSKYWK